MGYELAISRLLFCYQARNEHYSQDSAQSWSWIRNQPADGFKEFMHANPNNLSNFNTWPQNVLVLPSAMPVLEPEVFDRNPANYRNFIDAFDALITFNVSEPIGGDFSISWDTLKALLTHL